MRVWVAPWMMSALLLAGAPAAQPEAVSAHSEQERETARALYKLGNERYASGDYHGALEAFLGAHRIMRAPTTALGLGKAQMKLGLLLEARATLGPVAVEPETGEPEPFVHARAEAVELHAELGRRIPKLTVRITTEGPASHLRVSIDGRVLEAGELTAAHELNPGTHVVQVTAQGHVADAASVQLEERESRVLHLMLARLPPPPEPKPVPPRAPPRLPPGPRADPPPPTAPSSALPMAVAGFSVAGVAGVAGIVTGVMSLSAARALERQCDASKVCPPAAQADRERSLTTAHVSTASFAIAGAGVVVGVAGVILGLPDDESGARSARMRLGIGYLGLEGQL